ncbi:MAG: hypothetical protein KBD63_01220 [Bacteriovoracaceae bacterium]|nr:hypothetical protein [Bacteriovoracaceae bacterium]
MKKVLFLFSILVSIFCLFSCQKKPQGEGVSLNQTMRQIEQNLSDLFPYMFNEKKFQEQKNKDLIVQKIKDIKDLFHTAKPHFDKKNVAFQISSQVIDDYLAQLYTVTQKNPNEFAQKMLKNIPSLCISCHTQDQKERHIFKQMSAETFSHDFEYAEYLYMTRSYHEAVEVYTKVLNEKSVDEQIQLGALRRVLAVLIQMDKKPKEALDFFKNYSKSGKLYPFNAKIVEGWIVGINEWIKKDELLLAQKDFASLSSFISKHFEQKLDLSSSDFALQADKEQIFYLRLSKLLYTYAEKASVEQIPSILYFLSLCDRALNFSYFYSLADLYLKECVTHYSQSPVAKQCYKEYEEHTIFSFTGSRGTDLPSDVKQELQKLKSMLKN